MIVNLIKIFIDDFVSKLKNEDWIKKIALFLNNNITEQALIESSLSQDPKTDKEQKCEAYFYIGMVHKFNKNAAQAKDFFEKSGDFFKSALANMAAEIAKSAAVKKSTAFIPKF